MVTPGEFRYLLHRETPGPQPGTVPNRGHPPTRLQRVRDGVRHGGYYSTTRAEGGKGKEGNGGKGREAGKFDFFGKVELLDGRAFFGLASPLSP